MAIVEFAPYQKIGGGRKESKQRKDPKHNTIDDDDDYKKFLETLESGTEVGHLPIKKSFHCLS